MRQPSDDDGWSITGPPEAITRNPPPASKQALEGLSKKGAEWGTSPPDEQRRRSIYMFTKRSLLLPLLTVFDSSDTTQPCVQRNVGPGTRPL